MRKGYFTGPVMIILAMITLMVAITLFLNAYLLKGIKNEPTPSSAINSFEDCVRVGNRILLTYPRQCKTFDGKTFTEIINETANWKTYQGDAFGTKFTFQYPPSLTLKFNGPEGGGTVFTDGNNSELLTIYYNNKPSSQSLKDFSTEAAINSVYGGGKKLIKQSAMQVAGYEAFKNEIQMNNGQLVLQVFITDPKRNGSGYDNLYNIQNTNPNTLPEDDFNQILSTFQFLN